MEKHTESVELEIDEVHKKVEQFFLLGVALVVLGLVPGIAGALMISWTPGGPLTAPWQAQGLLAVSGACVFAGLISTIQSLNMRLLVGLIRLASEVVDDSTDDDVE